MARLIPEEPKEIYNPDDFTSQVREYVRLKETMDALDKRSKELRDKLMDVLDQD